MLLGEWLLAYLDDKDNRIKVARELKRMGVHKKHYNRHQRKTKKRLLWALEDTADTIKYSLDNPVGSGKYPSTTVRVHKYYAGWSNSPDTKYTYELELVEGDYTYSVMGIPFQELYNLKVEPIEFTPTIFASIWWDLTWDGWTVKSQAARIEELYGVVNQRITEVQEAIDKTSKS